MIALQLGIIAFILLLVLAALCVLHNDSMDRNTILFTLCRVLAPDAIKEILEDDDDDD